MQRARIVVSPEKVEVVVPLLMSERSIHTFVHDHHRWVSRTLDRIQQQQGERLAPDSFTEGAMIPFQGEKRKLSVRPSKLKRVKIEFDGKFIVHMPQSLIDTNYNENIKEALIKWMKNRVKIEAGEMAARHAEKYGLTPNSIRVRKQKSRWGSCGIHNDINLNWVLILADPEVLEYVVVHEICHIRFRDHSANFWSLVEAHLPEYKKPRNWLRKNGAGLMMGL